MATANKIPCDYSLELRLDRNEAETLYDILGKIGGSPEKSNRKYAQSILEAMKNGLIQ